MTPRSGMAGDTLREHVSVDGPSTASPANASLCLAIVATDSFVPGALTTVHSFLHHNRWFDGDIVILHDGLSGKNMEYLALLHPRVRFEAVGSDLVERATAISHLHPEFAGKAARFYSLAAFDLTGYDRMLYCDADLVFVGSIEGMLQHQAPIVAAGDGYHYRGQAREWEPLRDRMPIRAGERPSFERTFNSGLMLIRGAELGAKTYADLLRNVDPELFVKTDRKLTDQLVLNLHFTGRQELVSARYNFVLGHGRAIMAHEGLSQTQALVLHFNGNMKPWHADRVLKISQGNPAYVKAARTWHAAYHDCLTAMFLKRRMQQP